MPSLHSRLTPLFTALALVAFAANSVLMRLALADGAIDPASFTTARLISGATVLCLLAAARDRGAKRARDRLAPFYLWLYAAPVTFAYVSLDTGAGALILFGAVQLTMISGGWRRGERPRPLAWSGLLLALGGLVLLVLPGLEAPPPSASALMALAGVAWGLYSLRGHRSSSPVAASAGNFAWAVPPALLVSLVTLPQLHLTPRGLLLATISGGLASALGYVVWFAALRGLTAVQASSLQLLVPILSALGGYLLLGEVLSWRLVISAAAILGGVGLTIAVRRGRPRAEVATLPAPKKPSYAPAPQRAA